MSREPNKPKKKNNTGNEKNKEKNGEKEYPEINYRRSQYSNNNTSIKYSLHKDGSVSLSTTSSSQSESQYGFISDDDGLIKSHLWDLISILSKFDSSTSLKTRIESSEESDSLEISGVGSFSAEEGTIGLSEDERSASLKSFIDYFLPLVYKNLDKDVLLVEIFRNPT